MATNSESAAVSRQGGAFRRPGPLSTPRRARQAQVAILALVGGALAVTVWQSFTSVAAVSRTAGVGQGETFLHALRHAFRPGHLASEPTLKAILDENWRQGLRCILMLTPEAGAGLRVGTCETPDAELPLLMARFRPGQFSRIGDRLRMLHRPPPPFPPPDGAEPGWPDDGPPPPPPPRAGGPPGGGPPGGGPPGLSPGGPPGGPPGGGPPAMLIEYEPVTDNQLHTAAVRTLVIGIATLLALAASAFALWRLSERAEQLQTARENDRRLALLGEMSAVVAHELRNPLASLKGHAQLLAETLPAGGREHDKADRVVREAVRLEQLCEDLLSFVRSNNIEPQDVNAVELLRESAADVDIERLDIHAPEHSIRWRLDPVRMHQVLTNLLRNALQSEANGTHAEAAVGVEDGELFFSVRDHGSGIPADQLDSIFDPFVTTRARGTGLAVARRIVALHGGSITATNHARGGALFRVTIPRATAAAQAGRNGSPAAVESALPETRRKLGSALT